MLIDQARSALWIAPRPPWTGLHQHLDTAGGGHAEQAETQKPAQLAHARIALSAGVPLVPAAIGGTDRLSRLGPLSVAYGEPIDVSDLEGMETKRAASIATERLMKAIEELKRTGMTIVLAEQSLRFAERVADRVYRVEKGRLA